MKKYVAVQSQNCIVFLTDIKPTYTTWLREFRGQSIITYPANIAGTWYFDKSQIIEETNNLKDFIEKYFDKFL